MVAAVHAIPQRPLEVPPEIQQVAEEFEALFLAEFLAPIFEGLKTDGLGGGGEGERAFRPLLVQEYAKAIAASGGVGVADAVARELVALQTTPPERADD